ncbi:MAG: ABC transporter permease [Actinomycetota bacterium]|nr:ABC transporter permease [Actinomycetota bacterium]
MADINPTTVAYPDEDLDGRQPPPPGDDVTDDEAEGLSTEARSFGRQTWDRFRRHRVAMAGALGLVLLTASFWIGPWWSDYEFSAPSADLRQSPSLEHPFGTDEIGRDLMVRTFTGGQFSIRIAVIVALVATGVGTLFGALAGYFGGWVDAVVGQLINLFLIIPPLVVLLVFAIRYGGGPTSIALLLAALLWTRIARVTRGLFLQFKEQEFVQAARAAGAKAPRIIVRHILPNTMGPVLVEMTLLVGTAIILESTLSFLGLGVNPPTPTLGTLIAQAKGNLTSRPSTLLIPGFFVTGIVLCINFLGDGLRDALDPTSSRNRD